MAGLSKLFAGSSLLRSSLGKLRNPGNNVEQLRYSGHARIFRKRPGVLVINKLKDAVHFYPLGICFIPFGIYLVITHIIYGPCELTDYPEEGPPPRYWQYERTVPVQLYQKYLGKSDLERHESYLSKSVRESTFNRWNRVDKRVKHLQGERLDYKGYHYRPVTTSWVEYGDVLRTRIDNQREMYAIGKI